KIHEPRIMSLIRHRLRRVAMLEVVFRHGLTGGAGSLRYRIEDLAVDLEDRQPHGDEPVPVVLSDDDSLWGAIDLDDDFLVLVHFGMLSRGGVSAPVLWSYGFSLRP